LTKNANIGWTLGVSQAASLPHSIAHNAIEWGTLLVWVTRLGVTRTPVVRHFDGGFPNWIIGCKFDQGLTCPVNVSLTEPSFNPRHGGTIPLSWPVGPHNSRVPHSITFCARLCGCGLRFPSPVHVSRTITRHLISLRRVLAPLNRTVLGSMSHVPQVQSQWFVT